MDAHSVLVAARNLIDREGWVQRAEQTSYGYCIKGAVGMAGCGDAQAEVCFGPTAGGAFYAAKALRAELPVGGIAEWNDASGRTKREVLDLFDRAIAATAPEPAFESLGQEPATAREPITEVVA